MCDLVLPHACAENRVLVETLKVIQWPRSWFIAPELEPPEHPLVRRLCLLENLVDLITILSLRQTCLDQSIGGAIDHRGKGPRCRGNPSHFGAGESVQGPSDDFLVFPLGYVFGDRRIHSVRPEEEFEWVSKLIHHAKASTEVVPPTDFLCHVLDERDGLE